MYRKQTTHETKQERIITEDADEEVQKWSLSETLQKLQEQIKEVSN